MWRSIAIIGVLCGGCGPLTVQLDRRDDANPQPVIEEKVLAADVWASLANRIDKGTITTTNRLAQFVVQLATNGDLSTDDVSRFDQAFPDAVKVDRALNKDDSTKLRGIK